MQIAVVILHFGQLLTTKNCLQTLKQKIGSHRLILVNNTSADLSSLTKIIPGTQLLNNPGNLGFALGVNQGIKRALADRRVGAVFLLNNDLTLSFGSFNQLELIFAKVSTAGIVAPILHHPGGYDWGGRLNRWTGMVKHKNWVNKPKTLQSVQHLAGAAMLIKREVFEKIGLFDERFFLYFEDLDFCLRAKAAGYTLHLTPDVVAEHQVSASSSPTARTRYQWLSHLKFVGKYLFRPVAPTAFLYNFLFYPLILIKTWFKT